jgi:quinol monooxygenase YgiN
MPCGREDAMLIVAGSFQVDPSFRVSYINERLHMMTRCRSEQGCLEYIYSADPIEHGRVVLFERWQSEDAFMTHLHAEKSLRAIEPARSLPESGEVQIYDIARVRPIP